MGISEPQQVAVSSEAQKLPDVVAVSSEYGNSENGSVQLSRFFALAAEGSGHFGTNTKKNTIVHLTINDDKTSICRITKKEMPTQMQPEIQVPADKQGLTYDKACSALQKLYGSNLFRKILYKRLQSIQSH